MAQLIPLKELVLGALEGPHPQARYYGLLRYRFPITLIPLEPIADLHAEISVTVTTMWRIGLSGGSAHVDTPEGEANLARRLWHWVVPQLPRLVEQLQADHAVELRPTEADLDRLTNLVPEKLSYSPGTAILLTTSTKRTRNVFISCGQATADEISLGKEIANLVSSVEGFQGYFAQNQDSFAGVTEHILKAIHESAALVCVMHRRGEVSGRDGNKIHRASVWIEQEIAIATFIEQVLKRRMPVKLYCEKGIPLEGIRRHIMVHEVPFTSAKDVIDDLRLWVPKLTDVPAEGVTEFPLQEEHRLIEEGIKEYRHLGSPKPFLDRYPRVPSSVKRRLHDLILRGGRAARNQTSPDTPEEKLKALYPDE